jgi:hypothetical protein
MLPLDGRTARRNRIKMPTRLQSRDTRSRGARTLRLLLMAAAILIIGVAPSACGSDAGGAADDASSPRLYGR